MQKLSLWALLILLIFSSCARKSQVNGTRDRDADVKAFSIDEVDFSYFTSRAKFKYEDSDGQKLRATVNFRIKKDSLIWFSITPGFGIEAARGVITQDMIMINDRINRDYTEMSIEELGTQYNINLSYGVFEALILGNTAFSDLPGKWKKSGREADFLQEISHITIQNTVAIGSQKIRSLEMSSSQYPARLSAQYSNFMPLANQQMASMITAMLAYETNAGQSNISVEIEHIKPEISEKPLTFPFNKGR